MVGYIPILNWKMHLLCLVYFSTLSNSFIVCFTCNVIHYNFQLFIFKSFAITFH
jgi:hypothetical protein